MKIGEKGLDRKAATDAATQIAAQGFELLGDKVAIIRDPCDTRVGLIVLTDETETRPLRGTLVSIGDGVTTKRELNIGDRATFSKYFNVLLELPLVNGKDSVMVEVVHQNDLYFVWRH